MSALRLCAVLVLMLAGCVVVERRDYPADWSPLAPAVSGCPVLSGSYANLGQATVAADGSLVVERGGSMVGAMGLAWPVLVSGRSWSVHPAAIRAAH